MASLIFRGLQWDSWSIILTLFPSESDITVSFDVSALFTSVPVDKAITHIRNCLENDLGLEERTDLSPITIVSLLQFCINTTYFLYDGAFYQQRPGAAMGSLVSPVVAYLYMEWHESILNAFGECI